MPVPMPSPADRLDTRPTAEEAQFTAVGVASAVAPSSGLTDVQRVLIEALFPAMTDHPVDVSDYTPVTPLEFATGLARRDEQFRTRGVQVMLLCALVLRPLPPDVVDRVNAFAAELGVQEGMLEVAQRFASGSLGLAAIDFERNGYTSEWHAEDAHALHTSSELASAWDASCDDPELAARWAALGDLPDGTIGRMVWQMYRARGFSWPGQPGSAPPLLAQHDWVHVLAGFGTTVESELEVFAFIARANDDMRAFSLLAMVISLFETGYLRTGAGLFEYDLGHLSAGAGMAIRVADAMRRGAWCKDTVTGADSIDFLQLDWFALADQPVDEVRARFSVRPPSTDAIAAGSVSAWQPGGISPFQLASGRAQAEREGRPYESWGARLTDPPAPLPGPPGSGTPGSGTPGSGADRSR
ncbi:MAG: hypothetical protein ACXWB2_12630 [Acidimicrobiales bacterium]